MIWYYCNKFQVFLLQTPEKRHFLTLEDICKTLKWKLWVTMLTQLDWKVPFDFHQLNIHTFFFAWWNAVGHLVLDLFFETCRPYMIVISKINWNFFYNYHLNVKKKISYLPSQLTSAVCVHNRKTKSVLESMLKTSLNSLVVEDHENIKLRLHRTNWLKHRFETESSRKLKTTTRWTSFNAVHLGLSQ